MLKKLDKFFFKHRRKVMLGAIIYASLYSFITSGFSGGNLIVLGLIGVYFLSNYIEKKLHKHKVKR